MLYDFSWTDFKQTSLYPRWATNGRPKKWFKSSWANQWLILGAGGDCYLQQLWQGVVQRCMKLKGSCISERPPSTGDGSVASLRHPAWLQTMAMVSQQLSTAQTPWERLPKSWNFWPSLSLTSFMNLLSLLSFIFLSLEAPFSLQKRMFQLKINKGAWQIKTEFSAISQMVLSIHLLICFTLWLM